MRVVVLGGGVIGVTTAYYLATEGHEVTVIEREHTLASRTSDTNAGMISPGHASAWASPAAPWILTRSLLGAKTAIRVRPSLDRDLVPWGLRFLGQCTSGRARHNTLLKIRLCRYSKKSLDRLVANERIDFAATDAGALYLHRSRRSLDAATARMPMFEAEGLPQQVLDSSQCVRREPALAPVQGRIAGAILSPGDASGNCRAFTLALAERCRERGVTFLTGVAATALRADPARVTAVLTTSGPMTADCYVVAMGAQSAALARTVGQPLPIYPVRGFTASFPVRDPDACPRLPGVDEHFLVAWSHLDGVLRMSSTAEFGARRRAVRPSDHDQIRAAGRELFPGVTDFASGELGVGFRPMTPDGRPIIGRGRQHNLVYNTGHGNMGWTMSCGSARLVADLVAARQPEIDLAGFAPRW